MAYIETGGCMHIHAYMRACMPVMKGRPKSGPRHTYACMHMGRGMHACDEGEAKERPEAICDAEG